MKIVPLWERPDLIGPTAALFRDIWPDHYGPGGAGDAQADLQNRCRAQGLPYAMLCVGNNGRVLGSGSLSGQSFGQEPGEGLWLVGLCVVAGQRRKGIGAGLVKALAQHARSQDYSDLYTTTQNAAGLLRSLGWVTLRDIGNDDARWQVLRKAL
ncbi:GNAT family N-acetyltransferase [Loktanella agnita]|uniref:GNAT family N-acetyltransferase n=1 Tax=Loktanella agnita TaxID=287097 RepID=UPI0039862A92